MEDSWLSEILGEARKSSAFYARSLLYSDNAAPEVGGPDDIYTYQSILDILEGLEEEEDPIALEFLRESAVLTIHRRINDSYKIAHRILLDRSYLAVSQYKRSRGQVREISTTDRNEKIPLRNVVYLSQKSQSLLGCLGEYFSEAVARGYSPDGSPVEEWEVIRTNGEIIMSEISFLGERTDNFNNLSGIKKSIAWAIAAIVISTIISVMCALIPGE